MIMAKMTTTTTVIDRQDMRRAGDFLKSLLSVRMMVMENQLKGSMRVSTGVVVVVRRIASFVLFLFCFSKRVDFVTGWMLDLLSSELTCDLRW